MNNSFCDIKNLIFDIRKWITYIKTNFNIEKYF